MTSKQLRVLRHAAGGETVKGLAINYAWQAGMMRQVKWLLERKLVRQTGGRVVATVSGRKILDYQLSN